MNNKLFKVNLISCLCMWVFSNVNSQTIREGQITFNTSTNVYIQFQNTDSIKINDTLYVMKQKSQPLFVVQNISSKSVVAKKLTKENFIKGTKVYQITESNTKTNVIEDTKKMPLENTETQPITVINEDQPQATSPNKKEIIKKKTGYNGRISVSSNSQSNNIDTETNTRLRTSITLNTNHEKGLISASQTYLSYRKNLDDTLGFLENLRIYSLALELKLNEKNHIWVGRRINQYVANIGASDGLQYDFQIKRNLTVGLFGGTRPDFTDYGFNAKLPQYGAYINHIKDDAGKYIQSSLGIVNQTNNGNTDRRFIYLQHNNNSVKNLSLFGSLEADLYEKRDSVPSNIFRLTGLYLQMRYKFSRKVSFTTAYDNRQNIIYFESYKNYIDDRIDYETRQGLRFQINLSPIRNLNINASQFYRFQKSYPTTNNFFASATISRIKLLNSNLTVNYNTFETSYLSSSIIGGRWSMYLFKSKVNLDLSYRKIKYDFSSDVTTNQDAYGFNISYLITRMLNVNLNFEKTKDKIISYDRFFVTLTRRIKG